MQLGPWPVHGERLCVPCLDHEFPAAVGNMQLLRTTHQQLMFGVGSNVVTQQQAHAVSLTHSAIQLIQVSKICKKNCRECQQPLPISLWKLPVDPDLSRASLNAHSVTSAQWITSSLIDSRICSCQHVKHHAGKA